MKARLLVLAVFGICLALLLVVFGGVPSVLAQRPAPTPPFTPRLPNIPTPVPNRNSGTRATRATTASPILLPPNQGRFTFANTVEAFPLVIQNTGGADVFDITATSGWALLAFKADGVTLLSDTNGNGSVDTGPVAAGATANIVLKIIVPKGPLLGASNLATVNVRSAASGTSTATNLELAIPTQFAQVYDSTTDGQLSLQYSLPAGTTIKKINTVSGIPDPYDTAIAATPSGGFVYVWNVNRMVGPSNNILVSDIEYTILDRNSNPVRVPSKLTNNGNAPYQVQDLIPAVAVAPNGRIGILWWTEQKPNSTTFVDDIWLSVLDATGAVLQQAKIAENIGSVASVLGNPQIAATNDSRFVLAWHMLNATTAYDVWYQVRDSNGNIVLANNYPLTNASSAGGGYDWLHSVTTIQDNSALITWWCFWHLCEAAVASNGAVYQSADIQTTLGDATSTSVRFQGDAVTTSDGKVVIVWTDYADSSYNNQDQLAYVVLDRNLSPIGAVTPLTNFQAPYGNNYVSASADMGGRAVFTWTDCYGLSSCSGAPLPRNLYYALVNSAGTVVTPPVIYRASASAPIYTSITGYGNAPYNPFLVYFPFSGR